MCNAYGLNAPIHRIAETFADLRIPLRFDGGAAPNLPPRDMIRPTEPVTVVRPSDEGGACLEALRWGFAPARPKSGPVINFRSEGRRFPQGGRVLILASHFFEYTGERSPKVRWRLTRVAAAAAEDPFAIAGWSREPQGVDAKGAPWPASVSMLTCAPGPDVAPIHDRQVVVLARDDWRDWLFADAGVAAGLLRPAPAGSLSVRRDA